MLRSELELKSAQFHKSSVILAGVISARLSYQLGPGQDDLDSFVLPTSQLGFRPNTTGHPTSVHRIYLEKEKGKGSA